MKILNSSFFDGDKLTDEVVAGYTAPMQNNSWKASLWRFMTASQRNQVRDNLWRIDIPTFVITGDHDKIVKVEDTFKVAERILGHSIYLVPNSGHLAHEETPEDFLRVTKRFIEKNT
jgi:pimeloyl-ACP methyl ester carboxylesterase